MAPKLSSFSIVLVLVMLVFSQVLARELMKKMQDGKVFDLGITDDYAPTPPKRRPFTPYRGLGRPQHLRPPYYGFRPRPHPPPPPPPVRCCRDAEYIESGKKVAVAKADRFNGDEQEGHGVASGPHGRNGGGRS